MKAARARLLVSLLSAVIAVSGCSATGSPETVTVTSTQLVGPGSSTSAAPLTRPTTPADASTSDPASSDPVSSDPASSGPGTSSSSRTEDPAPPDATVSSPTAAGPGAYAWPATGAAAIQVDQGPVRSVRDDRPRAIASVAKMMTAYLILLAMPLAEGEQGPAYTVTAADVADSDRRYRLDQSGVPVKKGEVISERDMLEALLLPSANNIAAMLAAWQSGSEAAFVAAMNGKAAQLGMTHTRYTDPSGYLDTTVSTAGDQLLLVDAAMRDATFAALVKLKVAQIPVAGTIYNTNPNLGKDGFVGVKTGSDDAAGGCLAFRVVRTVGARRLTITGVVLGQPGPNLISAGATAARRLAASVTG